MTAENYNANGNGNTEDHQEIKYNLGPMKARSDSTNMHDHRPKMPPSE
jgi:hypothetical protein